MPGMSHGTRPLAELIFLGGQELFRQVPPFLQLLLIRSLSWSSQICASPCLG